MPIWFQILTGTFAIANVIFSIIVIIARVIYNSKKNKINTKNISVSFTFESTSIPKQLEGHPVEAFNCFVFCTNKTNKKLAIHKIELITAKNIKIELSNHKNEPVAFYIEPNSTYVHKSKIAILPDRFDINNNLKIRLQINEFILDYE